MMSKQQARHFLASSFVKFPHPEQNSTHLVKEFWEKFSQLQRLLSMRQHSISLKLLFFMNGYTSASTGIHNRFAWFSPISASKRRKVPIRLDNMQRRAWFLHLFSNQRRKTTLTNLSTAFHLQFTSSCSRRWAVMFFTLNCSKKNPACWRWKSTRNCGSWGGWSCRTCSSHHQWLQHYLFDLNFGTAKTKQA